MSIPQLKKLAGAAFVAGFVALPLSTTAQAAVTASIDISTQRMKVSVDGFHYATWKVSTGARGYRTPTGTWRPKWMSKMHYSRKYNNAPMPYSIFFKGGYAVHGTDAIRRLGRPASHGCIRLHPKNARTLFSLVKQHGMANTNITIRH
ncbi:MAG: L,D-transpeptidase [Rhizobiales bacterium]|nr:L,D-transpeptidase [Hyphomicrobiales bacterium]